jgi:putative colanic acid biosynthesis glycosyltransferase
MKIAQVDVNYNFSSTGKIVADLITGLGDLGHSTVTCFGRGPDFKNDNVHRISSRAEVLLHALGTRFTGLTGGFSPLATRRLIGHLEHFMPDVVHLHDLHGYYINIRPLIEYLKAKRIPTVWTFHSEFMYTGKCGHAFDCEKWKTECNNCPDLKGYPKSWLFDFTTRMFREKQSLFADFEQLHLVAPSEWLANRMRQSIVRDKPIFVIHNGLDIATFCRRDTKGLRSSLRLTNEYVVLSVGSDLLSELKGGRWVLELAKRNPNTGMVFVMVGVEQAPKQIPDNVRIIPRIFDQNLLAEYYSLANVLLLTSTKETFSMVSAESLACGTPVIGFDSGAPKEVALPGFGEFVPYADLDALESLLFRVKTGEIALMPSTECAQFARERYSKDAMVKAYESIYRKLMDRYLGRQ